MNKHERLNDFTKKTKTDTRTKAKNLIRKCKSLKKKYEEKK